MVPLPPWLGRLIAWLLPALPSPAPPLLWKPKDHAGCVAATPPLEHWASPTSPGAGRRSASAPPAASPSLWSAPQHGCGEPGGRRVRAAWAGPLPSTTPLHHCPLTSGSSGSSGWAEPSAGVCTPGRGCRVPCGGRVAAGSLRGSGGSGEACLGPCDPAGKSRAGSPRICLHKGPSDLLGTNMG